MGSMPSTFRHFPSDRIAQPAEARRRERRECWFESSRDLHFRTRSLGSEASGFYPDEQGAHPCGFTFSPKTPNQPYTMKITKALKLKNQLAGDVAELKNRLAAQNSRASTVPFDYDANEVLTALRAKVDELVAVKSAIAVANVAIYPRIFRLAELKGLVTSIKVLDTRQGVFREGGGFALSAVEVEYVAQLKKSAVDALVVELEAEISAIQDELDEFNQSQSVPLTA